MKKVLLIPVFLFLIATVTAQYYYNGINITPGGNPGNLNTSNEEPYGNGLDPAWVSIQPATAPAWTATQTLPFSFLFNGQPVTQYKVSTSGVLTFDVSATVVPGNHMTIPNSAIPDKSVMIWGLAYSAFGPNINDHIVKRTFGTAPNRQHWIMFASYNIEGGNFECWTYWSIVLEESTNKIYFVDQRNSTKMGCWGSFTIGIQVDGTTAYSVTGSPNIHSNAGISKTPSDNKYYEFIPGVRPNYDMGITWVQTGTYQTNHNPVEIRGTLKNFGLLTVTSYDINYKIGNYPVKTEHVSCNLSMYAEEWYLHDSLWVPDTIGSYPLKIWASNINGNIDQNPFNDTVYRTLEVMGVFVPRRIMHEVFVSSSSVDCKQANDTLKPIFQANYGEFSVIKYPMNYPAPGDPYYTAECGARKTFYGVDSIPDMFVNGIHHLDPRYYTQLWFDDYAAPSYMSITINSFTITGTKVDLALSMLPFPDWTNPPDPLKLHVALVETETKNNVTTNGETKFSWIMKKMVPNENGTAVGPFNPGYFVNKNFSYTFPAGHTVEKFSNLAAVVFLQNSVTKEIYQSAVYMQNTGINDHQSAGNAILSIAPNPASQQFVVQYYISERTPVKISLLNSLGQQVYFSDEGIKYQGVHATQVNTGTLDKGLYLLTIQSGYQRFVKKVVIE